MKILATSDLHIWPHNARRDTLADQEGILSQIVAVAREEEVELCVLAGDVFHRPKPPPEVLNVFRQFALQLQRAGIPTVAIVGNESHDTVNRDVVCALELFGSEWLRVSRTPELIRAVGDIAVCTLPSVPMHRLVASANGGDRTVIHQQASEYLMRAARDLREEVPDGWPCVLVAHWMVSGASLPNGLPVEDFDKPILPLAELEDLDFDAIILGDIHKPQRLATDPTDVLASTIFYCGSPACWDFNDTLGDTDHGCWIVTLDDQRLAPEARFVPLDDRRFVTVDVDLTREAIADGTTETDEIAGWVMASQIAGPLEGAVVRLRYRATEEQHRRVDRRALLGLLEEAGVDKVHGPTWEPVRSTRARVEVDGDGITDHEALQMWVDAVRLGEEQGRSVHLLLDRIDETVTA